MLENSLDSLYIFSAFSFPRWVNAIKRNSFVKRYGMLIFLSLFLIPSVLLIHYDKFIPLIILFLIMSFSIFFTVVLAMTYTVFFVVACILYSKLKSKNTFALKLTREYKQDVTMHMESNISQDYLENKNCKLLLYYQDAKTFTIRLCDKRKKRKMLEIYSKTNNEDNFNLLATIWLYIQTYFNNDTTFFGILFWLCQIDNNRDKIGIRKYDRM